MPIPRLRVCGLSLGESSKKISAIYFISDSNLIWSGHLTSFYSIDSRPDIMGTLDYIRDYIRAIGSQLEAISASVPWGDFLLSFMFTINCTVVQNSDFIKKSRIWLPL